MYIDERMDDLWIFKWGYICTQNIHNLSIRSQASEEERRIRNRVKVHTDRTRFDNATRFFDFHWPITLILVKIFQIFRSAITFWVIWSTSLLKFALNDCFINFQKLKNRVALSNRVRCVWTLNGPKNSHKNLNYQFTLYYMVNLIVLIAVVFMLTSTVFKFPTRQHDRVLFIATVINQPYWTALRVLSKLFSIEVQ
jgi:hypothetical protein